MGRSPRTAKKRRIAGLKTPNYTRVAVVRIDVHPAALAELRSPLEDPIFEPGKPDSLRPASGTIPERFRERATCGNRS